MTWLRLDDGFAEHDKILPLTAHAFRLHITGLLACARNLTDGHINHARFTPIAATAKATRKHAVELEHAGLWKRVPDGWQIHDYLEYNSSSENVRSERAKTAERQRRWKEQKRDSNADSNDVSNGVTNAAPSHPIPSSSTKEPSFLPSRTTDGTEGRNGNQQPTTQDDRLTGLLTNTLKDMPA